MQDAFQNARRSLLSLSFRPQANPTFSTWTEWSKSTQSNSTEQIHPVWSVEHSYCWLLDSCAASQAHSDALLVTADWHLQVKWPLWKQQKQTCCESCDRLLDIPSENWLQHFSLTRRLDLSSGWTGFLALHFAAADFCFSSRNCLPSLITFLMCFSSPESLASSSAV